MDIYIKPSKKVNIAERKSIYIKDIAEVFAPSSILEKVKNIKILKPDNSKKESYLITIIDIISAIDKALPGNTISNVGEMDTVLEYSPEKARNNKIIEYLKIILVVIILFAGSATAIMSFHSDAEIGTIFENYYYIFFNERIENPLVIDLPYALGIAFGIIVFFNHFMGKKVTNDPTPIEVEFTEYESKVSDNIIDSLSTERIKGDKNGNT